MPIILCPATDPQYKPMGKKDVMQKGSIQPCSTDICTVAERAQRAANEKNKKTPLHIEETPAN